MARLCTMTRQARPALGHPLGLKGGDAGRSQLGPMEPLPHWGLAPWSSSHSPVLGRIWGAAHICGLQSRDQMVRPDGGTR